MGEQSDSDIAEHVYELLFELNRIEPSVLLAVLPQLEYKLKVCNNGWKGLFELLFSCW